MRRELKLLKSRERFHRVFEHIPPSSSSNRGSDSFSAGEDLPDYTSDSLSESGSNKPQLTETMKLQRAQAREKRKELQRKRVDKVNRKIRYHLRAYCGVGLLEQDEVVENLITVMISWENLYQVLRWRRNVCDGRKNKLNIPREQLQQRLHQELQAFANDDVSIFN